MAGGGPTARRSAVEKQLCGKCPPTGARWSRHAAGASFRPCSTDVVPSDEGVLRARSATEAFLYRRLETLTDTAGRFRLNAELPIPFDGCGQMEVDLLCADLRVSIELDGSQHLDGDEAYRRDRRKDLLLQEHGYFVLRFLATDVGRRLDTVLDTILRTLSHRRRD
jgi:very-short-patch-repair endonuclease